MKEYKSLEILRPFERNGSFPIDKTSVFYSYESAVKYAHTDISAYPGQIISVIDEEHEKTAIFKLDYDKDKVFRLVLQPITVGAATADGDGGFNLLGIVDTRDDLPTVNATGDMYLVKDENIFYVAIETSEDNVEWQSLNLQVDLVTEIRDGIFRHQVYSTMINRTGTTGVYFSAGDGNPENNRWLEVETTTVEQERGNFTMLSIGRVKQIVSTMTNASKPHVEIISATPVDNYVLNTIAPHLTFVYYPELGGKLKRITLYQDNELNAVLDTIPEERDLQYNSETRGYSYSVTLDQITSDIRRTYIYKVHVEYEQSDDGNIPAGYCENIIKFNFYNDIQYGTNIHLDNAFAYDGDNVINLEYHPELTEYEINTIVLRVPHTHYLKDVTFVNQNDLFARSLFTGPNDIGQYREYTYYVPISFKSPGKFILYISEENVVSEQ